jgi:hypothetical protein
MKPQKRKKLEAFILQRYMRAPTDTKGDCFQQFAKELKVSVHEVYKWRDGYRTPRMKMLHKIERLSNGDITLYDW